MPEVAQATIVVTPVLKGAQQSLTEQLTDAAGPAGSSAGTKAGTSFSQGMSKAGGAMSKTITPAIMGIGAAALASWKEVDTGLDTIVKKTGASGESLDGMHDILNNITTSIPTDFATAGAAIGEVNTRFGSTGQELEDLSTQFIKFAQLNGVEVSSSVDKVQSAMAAFGMDASNASDVLDIMNKVGQDTGISMDTLASDLLTNNNVLQDMGLNFNEAANFIGSMNKEGASSSEVMTGLKQAMKNAAKEGKSTGDALGEIQDSLVNASTDAEAAQTAMELFGTRSGAAIARMVRDGRLDFEDFSGSVEGFAGSVSDTFDQVTDPMDQFKTVTNELKIAGSELIEAMGPALSDAVSGLADFVSDLADKWSGLSPEMQDMIIKIGGIVAVAGPLLAIGGTIIGGVGKIAGGIGGLVGKIGSLGGAAGTAAGPVATAGGSFGTMAGQALKMIAGAAALVLVAIAIGMLVDSAIEIAEAGPSAQIALAAIAGGIIVLMAVTALLAPALTAGALGIVAFGAAVALIGVGVYAACEGIADVIDAISNLVSVVADNSEQLNSIIQQVGDTISQVFETVATGISDIVTSIGDCISTVVTAISDGISGVVDSIGDAISGVLDSLSGVIESIGNAALNAGQGFEMLANALINLTNNTSLGDLAGTLLAVSTNIGKINDKAKGSDAAAANIDKLGTAMEKMASLTETAKDKFEAAMESASQSTQTLVSAIDSMDLGGHMQTQMSNAISVVSSGISQLQSMFSSTRFSFNQSIALPHFSMSGTFDAQTGSVPTVSVNWYKKAAEYGALFTDPAIIGVGDSADPELLIGENKLKQMLGNGANYTYNVTVNGADSPEMWAARFVRETKQYQRIS